MHKRKSSEIVFRELTKADLSEVAEVHLDSFLDSNLNRLGATFVERYYLWQLTGPHRIVRAFGAFDDGSCVGFSFGGSFKGSFSGFIRENKGDLVKAVVRRPWLVFNKKFRGMALAGAKMLLPRPNITKNTSPKSPSQKTIEFGVLSIAVAREYRKLGIGERLISDAEAEAAKNGFVKLFLQFIQRITAL